MREWGSGEDTYENKVWSAFCKSHPFREGGRARGRMEEWTEEGKGEKGRERGREGGDIRHSVTFGDIR